MRSKEPLTYEQVWGNNGNFNCAIHPDRIGFVDLGAEEPNRYPCRECYMEIVRARQNEAARLRNQS